MIFPYSIFNTVAGYDEDAEEIFAAFASAGSPANTARKIIINANVLFMKATGRWAKSPVIYRKAAHSEAAGKVNWKTPGVNDLVSIGSTFIVDEGFSGGFLSTGIIQATIGLYDLDDACTFAYCLDDYAEESALFGVFDGTNLTRLLPKWSDNNTYYSINGNTQSPVASPGSNKLQALVRNDALEQKYYRDAVLIDTAAAASTALATIEMLFNGSYDGSNSLSSSRRNASGGLLLGNHSQANLKAEEEDYLIAIGAPI